MKKVQKILWKYKIPPSLNNMLHTQNDHTDINWQDQNFGSGQMVSPWLSTYTNGSLLHCHIIWPNQAILHSAMSYRELTATMLKQLMTNDILIYQILVDLLHLLCCTHIPGTYDIYHFPFLSNHFQNIFIICPPQMTFRLHHTHASNILSTKDQHTHGKNEIQPCYHSWYEVPKRF